MYRIGITGITGFIGWHVRCRLYNHKDIEIIPANRQTFQTEHSLNEFVKQCDGIVHLAGLNHGEDSEIKKVNVGLANALIKAMEHTDTFPNVVYASSTHIYKDTAYGRSKHIAGKLFSDCAKRHGARFTNLILPHIFGEGGRPFYNSAVSTFCHQLAIGETPQIDIDGQLELLHVQDVAVMILNALLQEGESETINPSGHLMPVSELLFYLETFQRLYVEDKTFPHFQNRFHVQLFNTFRSYLFPEFYPVPLKLHTDDRGALVEAVKSFHGGQAFFSTTKPGITRGNHFHFGKIERFLVVAGKGIIRLRRLFNDSIHEFHVSGDVPSYIDIPSLYTHNITNCGHEEMLTLFWSHEIFDPLNLDTYPEIVEKQDNPL